MKKRNTDIFISSVQQKTSKNIQQYKKQYKKRKKFIAYLYDTNLKK